jgi:hypothetical protein
MTTEDERCAEARRFQRIGEAFRASVLDAVCWPGEPAMPSRPLEGERT